MSTLKPVDQISHLGNVALCLHASEFQGLWRGICEHYLSFLRVYISLMGSNFPSHSTEDAFKVRDSVNLTS